MPLPLALVTPAAVAGLAYLNAKTQFSQDASFLYSVFYAQYQQNKREKTDRLNMFYQIEEHAHNRKLANQTFLIYSGRHYTYRQFYDIILSYGTWLKQNHYVRPKEIVAMVFGNSDVYIFIWFALWSIGAYPAFINYNLVGTPLAHTVRSSTARLVLIDPEFDPQVTQDIKDELSDIEWITFSVQCKAAALETKGVRAPDSDRSENKASNMAMLIFTSGTTGLPKPAIIAWSKANSTPTLFGRWMGYNKSDILYTSMPLYHSSASVLGVGTTVCMGRTICIGRKFSTKVFWDDVRESKATIIQYVGETCRYLLSAAPQFDRVTGENLDKKHHVRMAFGNGLRLDIWNRFKERFAIAEIAEFYAATEGSGAAWNFSRNDLTKGAIGRFGTLFRLMRGVREVVEVDWETEEPWRDPKTGFCKQVAVGQPGELLYKLDPEDIGRGYQGYFGNEKASNSKLMRDVLIKGDVYFRTGDTVRVDNESRTFFTDRIGDTFRWKGENVSTSEVSEVLGTHYNIKEANVYGVELPNHDGRAGCVAIILAKEPSDAVMSEIATHAQSQLPKFAVPLFLRVTKSMELTGTNKQQKHIIRAHGVDPTKMGEDEMYWLKDGTYVRFSERDWKGMNAGQVKL